VLLVCFFVRSLCFSNATAPTTIYTLSLHDALPILSAVAAVGGGQPTVVGGGEAHLDRELDPPPALLDERPQGTERRDDVRGGQRDRKSTRLNSSHVKISYAVFCLKKKTRRAIMCMM